MANLVLYFLMSEGLCIFYMLKLLIGFEEIFVFYWFVQNNFFIKNHFFFADYERSAKDYSKIVHEVALAYFYSV